MAHAYAHLFGLPCTGLRFFTVYGPWTRPDMALYRFADAIVAGRPIDVYGQGQMQRDFTYVDDAVEAFLLAATKDAAVGEIFNVGGTPPVQRQAFKFGHQKINLHVRGREFEPKAHLPVPGALDLCFIASVPLDEVMARVTQANWPIVEGPVMRTGATQKIRSIYLRDPDLNLIEISELV
jgi:catechol 2,3-dioxygenase-like lactoylglutathione lyase family enzyme